MLRLDQETNRTDDAGYLFDKPVPFERLDHFMNRRWRNPEVALQVQLRGRLAVNLGVVTDVPQILALFPGERWRNCRVEGRSEVHAHGDRPPFRIVKERAL
jgi:hypothetical protein